VNDAYRWAVAEFPNIDQALIAGWAEDLGRAMAAHPGIIEFPRRYAFTALKGKIFEWFRKHPVTEITLGIGSDLEQWIGLDRRAPLKIEQSALLEQLRMKLGDRDRQILILLLQDITSPRDVAEALNINYNAAAKAIQRAKERMAAILTAKPQDNTAGDPTGSVQVCKLRQ
jgi:DNA-directed RNA polymerase specialized sigma24 family protein